MTDGLFGASRVREVFEDGRHKLTLRHRGERITTDCESRAMAYRNASEQMQQLDEQAESDGA